MQRFSRESLPLGPVRLGSGGATAMIRRHIFSSAILGPVEIKVSVKHTLEILYTVPILLGKPSRQQVVF